jgi:alpha-glucosidase
MQSLVQSTKEKPTDTLFLHVYSGTEKNVFTYYEDDGSTLAYKNGSFCKRNIEFNPSAKQLTIRVQEGSYTSQFKYIELIFHGFDSAAQSVALDDQKLNLQTDHIRLLDPQENLEDIYDKNFLQFNSTVNTCAGCKKSNDR